VDVAIPTKDLCVLCADVGRGYGKNIASNMFGEPEGYAGYCGYSDKDSGEVGDDGVGVCDCLLFYQVQIWMVEVAKGGSSCCHLQNEIFSALRYTTGMVIDSFLY